MKATAPKWGLYPILFSIVELLITSTQSPLQHDTQPAHKCNNGGVYLPL